MRRRSMLRRLTIIASLTIALVVMVGVAVTAHRAAAQTATTFSIESIGSQVGLGDADLKQVVIRVIEWALGFMTLVAVGFIIYGGFIWLTAAGNEDKIDKAKRIILQACIGLVVVLLAWAIVLFVARFFSRASNNGNTNNENTNRPCLPGTPGCVSVDDGTTFDVTAIATCAVGPDYSKNVPLSSKVAVFFNHGLNTTADGTGMSIPQKAVEQSKNLAVKQCNTASCAATTLPAPLLSQQLFTVGKATSTEEAPKTEWAARANSNTMTFNHDSYSTDVGSTGYRLFTRDTSYRTYLPIKGGTNALIDTTVQQKELEHCQSPSGGPIPGDSDLARNCVEDTAANQINWTFATGQDVTGPPFKVDRSVPSSTYKRNAAQQPTRNLPRVMTICMQYTGAIDPSLVSFDNIRVTKYTEPPTDAADKSNLSQRFINGQLAAAPLPSADFTDIFFPNPTRFCITTKTWLEPYTWYQVHVQDVQNLCGTKMDPNPYEWVFETGNATPGVRVYPADNFDRACPSTKVIALFNTSMYNGLQNNCNVGGGSYVTGGSLTADGVTTGRELRVMDPFNPDDPNSDPNNTCKRYEFVPTTTLLNPGSTYQGAIYTNLDINTDGKKLEYGTTASGKPWSFKVVTADKCIQPPLITRISPAEGQNGQCVSVIGEYFEKATETLSNGKPETGDALTLGGRSQLNDPDVSWTNNSIVAAVDAGTVGESGSLARGLPYAYKVTVNYPAPIGPLSDEVTDAFMLNSGSGADNVCLYSLKPAKGPIGTVLSATGKNFGSYDPARSAVNYGLAPSGVLDYLSGWTDRRIASLRIPTNTLLGTAGVSVVSASGGQSNEIDFQTTLPPTAAPGAPRVAVSTKCDMTTDPDDPQIPSPNPRDGEQNACLTVRPEAWFTVAVQPGSLTAAGAVSFEDCTSGTCTAVSDTSVAVRPDHKSIQINHTANLTPSHTYRVTIRSTIQSEVGNIQMGQDFIWQFKTKSDNSDCPISRITINEKSRTFPPPPAPFSYPLTSSVRDANCQNIGSGACSGYTWSSKPTGFVDLLPNNTSTTTAVSVENIQSGSTGVSVMCQEKKSNTVTITYDPTYCKSNADCQENSLGEACPGSTCENNHCTPVVNRMVEDNGASGSGVTIHGCWFDSFVAGQSKVIFGSDQGASAKEAADISAICSNTDSWHNEWIVREVPDGAVTGRVKVVRRIINNVAAEATSSSDYRINAIQRPFLCKVYPGRGRPGSLVTASGAKFGPNETSKRPAAVTSLTTADAVMIKPISDTAGTRERAMTTYGSWADTVIGTAIPNEAAVESSSVVVKNESVRSNDVPYVVTNSDQGSCDLPCSGDDFSCPNTADGRAQACSNISNCCVPQPVITAVYPANNATGICRNTAISITYSLPLAKENIDTDHITYTDNGVAPTVPKVEVQNADGQGKIIYQPGLLSSNHAQVLTIVPNAVRGQNGALASLSGLPLRFNTGADICTLRSVSIYPLDWLAMVNGETETFTGTTESSSGGLLAKTTAYSWDWQWLSSNEKSVKFGTGTDNGATAENTATASSNGKASLNVCAQVTKNTVKPTEKPKLCARAIATVQYCPFPWTTTFEDSDDNCDVAGGGCGNYHFRMNYCRGATDATALPDFSYLGQTGSHVGAIEGRNSALGRLKSIFFKETADSTDAIGILIYANPDRLSPVDWYTGRGGVVGSTPTIGGYPAVQSGTTTIVGVTDFTGTAMQNLIFVFDYNSNQAEGATKQVYTKLLANLAFNTNMGSDVTRTNLQRDTQRVQDLSTIAGLLAKYKNTHGSYPKLDAGTYTLNASTTRWPSWQANLGAALGRALPVDPNNNFAKQCKDSTQSCTRDDQCIGSTCTGTALCASPLNSDTCWGETSQTFQCPAGSSVYMYRSSSDGASYTLYATMEYSGTGTFADGTAGTDACAGLTGAECRCFNYHLSSTP